MRRFLFAGLVVLLPLAARAETVTLDQAVARALSRHPNVIAAQQAIARADAILAQSRATLHPTLFANALYTRLDDERVIGAAESRRVVAGRNQVQANVQLAVPILQPQGLGNRNRASDNLAVTTANEAEVRRQIAIAAARAYLAVVSQKRFVETSTLARDTARTHHEYERTRLAGGLGRSLDEVRAAQEVAISESQLENAQMALARGREALGLIVVADGPVDTAPQDTVPPTPTLAEGLAATEGRRDVAAAKARVEAAQHARRDRWTFYAPLLQLVGTPFFQDPATIVNPTVGWQAQAVLSLPIYDGGRREGVFREQDATLVEAQAQLEAQLRQARYEVRTGFEAVLHADRGLEAARSSRQLAEKALELATLAYKAGATSNLEVVDAERRARDARTIEALAEDTARLARLELLAAAGKFPAR